MKALFFTAITAILILAGCQAYGSVQHPEPATHRSEHISHSLSHYRIAPSHCPFIQAGHF